MVDSVEAAKKPGAPEGTVNNPYGIGGKSGKVAYIDNVGNSDVINKPKKDTRKRGNKDPERIISRLKRDAETDPKAAALLGSIEAGDIKPFKAAKEMGWVKTPDPARIVERPPVDRIRGNP